MLQSALSKYILFSVSLIMPASVWASTYHRQPVSPNNAAIHSCTQEYCDSLHLYSYKPLPVSEFDDTTPSELAIEKTARPQYLYVPQEKNWQYLKEQTYTILGLSIATVGMMTLLPESITKWDTDQRNLSNLGNKWWENVRHGPTWDRDEHFLNYIMHPYFGGVYYTAARHAGYDEFHSFLYSATMSALFWEYGVEAFAEVPSWQDLFITPFFGAVVGEMMLQTEQGIIDNGGEVAGSETLGDISLFFLNPVGHIHYWVKDAWNGSAEVHWASTPWFDNTDAAKFAIDSGASSRQSFFGMALTVTF